MVVLESDKAAAREGDVPLPLAFLSGAAKAAAAAPRLVAKTDADGTARFLLRPVVSGETGRSASLPLRVTVEDGGTPERWTGTVPWHEQPLRLALLAEGG